MRRCLASSSRLIWHSCRVAAITKPCVQTRSLRIRRIKGRSDKILPITSVDGEKKPDFEAELQQLSGLTAEDLLTRIESCLPSRLRSSPSSSASGKTGIAAIGGILLQGLRRTDGPVDVLYELAVTRGQWKAAVWISKQLLESAPTMKSPDELASQLVLQHSRLPSLDEMTAKGRRTHLPSLPQRDEQAVSLDALTSAPSSSDLWHHHVLGCIWRSLGLMTLACVRDHSISGGSVRPEILEILALFHHYGLMPASVYTFVPNDRSDAVQQPATLYLLSSRIMLALSDAAWRAHETETLALAEDSSSNRLERLGSSVRANIEAIKPEMWLELILWSALHGGWIQAGADVLHAVCKEQQPQWRAISWRRTLKEQLDIERNADINWNELLASFSISRKDSHDPSTVQVEHTISSELVNAYVEACVDHVGLSGGQYATPLERVPHYLQTYRQFLKQSHLNLHGGTWDATICRLVESAAVPSGDLDFMSSLVEVAPQMGDELMSGTDQAKPAHVLDANAALLGLLHNTLRAQIDRGNLPRALKAYQLIWRCVDDARARSIEDFFKSRMLDKALQPRAAWLGHFSSNVRLEHPAFRPHIPLETTAAFIDLVTQEKAFDLIFQENSDPRPNRSLSFTPPKIQWSNPAIASALARYAHASGQKWLHREVVAERYRLLRSQKDPMASLAGTVSVMAIESVVTRDWQTASSLVKYLAAVQEGRNRALDAQSIATLGSAILEFKYQEDHENEMLARKLLGEIVATPKLLTLEDGPAYAGPQRNILKILSLYDKEISTLSKELGFHHSLYVPATKSVNIIIQTIAATKGSNAALRLLQQLMSEPRAQGDTATPPSSMNDASGQKIELRQGLQPNMRTYMLVLNQIDAEAQDAANNTLQLTRDHDSDLHYLYRGMMQVAGQEAGDEQTAHTSLIKELSLARVNKEFIRLFEHYYLSDTYTPLGR